MLNDGTGRVVEQAEQGDGGWEGIGFEHGAEDDGVAVVPAAAGDGAVDDERATLGEARVVAAAEGFEEEKTVYGGLDPTEGVGGPREAVERGVVAEDCVAALGLGGPAREGVGDLIGDHAIAAAADEDDCGHGRERGGLNLAGLGLELPPATCMEAMKSRPRWRAAGSRSRAWRAATAVAVGSMALGPRAK